MDNIAVKNKLKNSIDMIKIRRQNKMKKILNKIGPVSLLIMVLLNSVPVTAAGKNSGAYKCNSFYGTESDAERFKKEILNKDSSYTSYYGKWSKVTTGSFTTKKRCIKYWASHGEHNGTVYGNKTNAKHTIKSGFKWSGGNLEFVFLAACWQLDGSGSNPRAKYAKSMIGDKAVRVICGYHEKAPSGTSSYRGKSYGADNAVVRSFFRYAKKSESVKSSWIKANESVNNLDYCVLTHKGNVQYSRFPGFGGKTYSRPGANSKTILRFTRKNPNGAIQCAKALSVNKMKKIQINDNIIEMPNNIQEDTIRNIPQYALKASAINVNVKNKTLEIDNSDDDAKVLSNGEIGDTEVKETTAVLKDKVQDALIDNYFATSSINLENAKMQITPIVMAEVQDDSSKEKEINVAYSVQYNNMYDGIEIDGDHYSAIIDDDGVKYSSLKWNNYKKVLRSKEETVQNDNLHKALITMTKSDAFSKIKEKSEIAVKDARIVFALNDDTNMYEPTWKIIVDKNLEEDSIYLVNCNSSIVKELVTE